MNNNAQILPDSFSPRPDAWYVLVSGQTSGKFTLGARLKIVLIAVSLIVGLNTYAPAGPTLMERLLASAIIASCFVPTWLWMDKIDRNIPFLSFISVFYAFFFAVPVFLLSKYSVDMFMNPLPTRDVTLALAYALLGLYCMYAGYYGIVGRGMSDVVPRFNLRWHDVRTVKAVSFGLASMGLLMSVPGLPGRVPIQLQEVFVYGSDLSFVGVCALVALQLTGKLDRLNAIVVWTVFVPLRFLLGMGGGGIGGAMAIGIMLVALYATIRREIPWLLLMVGILAVFVLRPVETPYRAMSEPGGPLDGAPLTVKIETMGGLLYRATIGGAVPPAVFIEVCASRLAQFTIFASIIDDTPKRVPYWGGVTYIPLLTKLIPRAVYPDKPQEVSGQAFGHRYGLISNENLNTTVNLPQLVECYVNFGVPGVIVGMFLIGLLYRLTIALYVHPGMGMGALVGAIYVSARIFDIGGAASLVLGGLPWDILTVAIFHMAIELAEMDSGTLFSNA